MKEISKTSGMMTVSCFGLSETAPGDCSWCIDCSVRLHAVTGCLGVFSPDYPPVGFSLGTAINLPTSVSRSTKVRTTCNREREREESQALPSPRARENPKIA